MEKKEFQNVVKDKMKVLGFRIKGNNCYKVLDNNYLIGVSLDHHPYCKGYFVEYGGLYLPDEWKIPFRGEYDWDNRFIFTINSKDNLLHYHIESIDENEEGLVDYCEYDNWETRELIKQLDLNIEKKLSLLYDKNYILEEYKKNLCFFISLPDYTIKKLMKMGDFAIDEVNYLRRKWGYSQIEM